LIVTLEDDDQRRRLVEDLRVLLNATNAAAVKDAQKEAGLLDGLSQHVGQISQNIVVAASAVLDGPANLSWLRDTFGDPRVETTYSALSSILRTFWRRD
jgi:hypothetical protein